jgi:succinoglycan biosynthesis transport protein ExoP
MTFPQADAVLNVSASRPMGAMIDADGAEAPAFEVARFVSALKRERRLILVWIAAVLSVCALYLLLATPLFKAETAIIIDTQTSRALEKADINTADAPTITDTSLVDSQVEILSSDGLAREVVRALNLQSDPEFVGPRPGLIGWIRARVDAIMKAIDPDRGPDDPVQRAVESFGKSLVVKRTGLTYVITITLWSESAQKAAKIANAIADIYLREVLQAKYGATKQTGKWLQDRLSELRGQANEAARAVEAFKARNNIVDTNRGLMNEQQLGELNSQISLAAAATAGAGARLAAARDVMKDPLSGNATADALNNQVFARLRAQYLDLETRAGDLSKRFGPDHGSVVNLRRQMEEIKKAALDQLSQIVSANENDFRVARAREDALRANLEALVSGNDQTSLAQVKLKELQSAADSLQTIYTTYLQKYQELIQRSSFPVSDARVVTEAVPPLKKSSPKTLLLIAGGLVLGAFFGVCHVLARELRGETFVVIEDVQRQTGVQCLGVLPLIRGPAKDKAAEPVQVDNYVNLFPYSRFAETMRMAKAALDAVCFGAGGKIVAVASATPGEGKSATAINFARLLAAGRAKTLLIDADFTTRALTRRLAPDARKGLIEVIEGQERWTELLIKPSQNDPDVLPCASWGRVKDRAEILQSRAFAELIEETRKTYDYVVLDLAPAVVVVDARIAASLIDAFLLVVEWRVTSRKVVAEALAIDAIRERTVGIMLNKVESDALKCIESYRGKAFRSYYI